MSSMPQRLLMSARSAVFGPSTIVTKSNGRVASQEVGTGNTLPG